MPPDIRKRSRIARGSCPTSLMSLRGPPTQVVNFQPSPESPASPAISPSAQMSTTVTSPGPRAVARSAVPVSSSPGSSPESLGDDDRRVESSVETPRPAAFAPATPLGESSQINSRIDPTDSPVGDDQYVQPDRLYCLACCSSCFQTRSARSNTSSCSPFGFSVTVSIFFSVIAQQSKYSRRR